MDSSRFASFERNLRLLKTWYLILTVLLFISLGTNAAWVQAASDPPVRVYTATPDDAGGGGSSSVLVVEVTPEHTAEAPLILTSVSTSHLSRHHDHICLVTASATVSPFNPPANANINIGLSRGEDRRHIAGTERPVQLVATADDDVEWEEVTTTFALTGVRRNETIRFSVRYLFGDGNLQVWQPSMTVVCLRDPI